MCDYVQVNYSCGHRMNPFLKLKSPLYNLIRFVRVALKAGSRPLLPITVWSVNGDRRGDKPLTPK